ncbi:MAG: muconolactone Delta-isomerase family protein [Actinomycetota bacterium]|nr:muconolactone Delta-isomerase family protein [Actinomycetota bacterium]
MEFLVRLRNDMPPDIPPERRAELRTAERARAMELRDSAILVKLWRVPGSQDAIGLFAAADATELHDALASLPMFPWQTITVEALATHPQESG